MAGRNRAPHYPVNSSHRNFRDGLRHVINPRPRLLPPHPAVLEEELEIQWEEMRRMASENRHLADDHLIIRSELAAAKDEIYRLGQLIPQLRADKELQARELIQKGLKLESELRATDPLKAEVLQLRAESLKFNALRQELSAKVQGLNKDLTRVQAENKQLPMMRANVDGLHPELIRAREAFEYEKKANLEQMEQKQVMEKNLITLARELEKLRAELSSDQRARAIGGIYALSKGSSEMGYTGTAFGDGYHGAWGAYDGRGPP
ncbi:hypothetical protein IFM89_020494 [Coptis chinensis]|uniref:Protein FLX-like 3 n=1 Tax=Coptis chinensis TaxID=261450 RepID=A0A835LF41_9MAGN|nr:hypothetical protein IFM89_020494 [Coptis chinensis]